jgi:hypothetical protein
MRSVIAGSSLGLLVLLFSSAAYGQAVTAQQRVTEETIAPNGKVIASHIRDGVYYRTSAGATLQQFTTLDGQRLVGQQAWAVLWDNGVNYQLDYTQHRAYVFPNPAFTMPSSSPKVERSQSSVEGIPCMLWPVYLVEAGTRTLIGHGCNSEKYNLALKVDVTIPGRNGQSIHKVTEMYGIQIGLEPDPKLFDVQHNFTIYRPDAAQQSRGTQQQSH